MSENTLLFPTDLAANNQTRLQFAATLAKALDVKLCLLHFMGVADAESSEDVPQALLPAIEAMRKTMAERRDAAEKQLKLEQSVVQKLGVECCVEFRNERASTGILDYAKEHPPAFVVLGLRSSSVSHSPLVQHVFGSTSSTVLRHSNVPVLALPPNATLPAALHKCKWVVGVDFSDENKRAISFVQPFVEKLQASIELVHISAPLSRELDEPVNQLWADHAKQQLDELKALLVPSAKTTFKQTPSDKTTGHALAEHASHRDASFLVLSASGKGNLKKFFLGSTAERTLRYATMPVFVVRG
ncbi:MAG: universal stress protein [Myxococcales bacterium]|nr:MAG: universal stress protein [Myxococcales bacterium]